MKKAVLFSLVLLIVALSTQVEGKKRKPQGRPTSPPKVGWRFGNGPCMCKGPRTTPGWHRTQQVRPTAGHYSSPGPHGQPRHYPSQPHGHHPSGPQGPSVHPSYPPRPHGPQGHHHNGPHSPPRHRSPTRRPMNHNHKHRGPMKHRKGHSHHRRPTRKQEINVWKKCVCRKPADKGFKIKFRMMKKWIPELANRKSEAYKRLTFKIITKLAIVLKTKGVYDMRYTKGSIVAEFEVKKSGITKDPEKALRHAINKGQMSDLKIQPESLVVHQSYSGVKLSEWKTDEEECQRCGTVKQTRDCVEVTASCDGIPLTRNASCYEACPRARIISCGGHRGIRMAKVMIIACFIMVGAIVIITVLVVTKVRRARRKQLSSSHSTSSVKKLTDDDKLQSKC